MQRRLDVKKRREETDKTERSTVGKRREETKQERQENDGRGMDGKEQRLEYGGYVSQCVKLWSQEDSMVLCKSSSPCK